MLDFGQFLALLLLLLIAPSIIFVYSLRTRQDCSSNKPNLPKSYPIIGHFIAAIQQKDRFQWLTNILISSPSSTFVLHRPFGLKSIQTADPIVIEHILKTNFHIYQKGVYHRTVQRDLLGGGIFNAEGESWKFQRQVASHEFSTKSLRKFVENVVDFELSNRLIPLLLKAAKDKTVLDLQDILQRFTFDNICKIAFGYDPEYLDSSLPNPEFAVAFEEATMISTNRFRIFFPISWKMCRFFNIGSEKKLKKAVRIVKEFAVAVVQEKKHEMTNNAEESDDLLSRFLKSGHPETFASDIVISFLLAGRDTTSAALTWFFWLVYKNKQSENEIRKEIMQNSEKWGNKSYQSSSAFDEVKDMVYTHAALCESMRLFPPVPVDIREAISDDVLPDGTPVKKGTWVAYHPYAMGRLEKLWGPDCTKYRPERWLKEGDNVAGKTWKFVPRDVYSYPIFHAGPRICLGKEMSFLQMKRVVAGVLSRFRVVPVEEGVEPVYVPSITSKMHGGFPVKIEERSESIFVDLVP